MVTKYRKKSKRRKSRKLSRRRRRRMRRKSRSVKRRSRRRFRKKSRKRVNNRKFRVSRKRRKSRKLSRRRRRRVKKSPNRRFRMLGGETKRVEGVEMEEIPSEGTIVAQVETISKHLNMEKKDFLNLLYIIVSLTPEEEKYIPFQTRGAKDKPGGDLDLPFNRRVREWVREKVDSYMETDSSINKDYFRDLDVPRTQEAWVLYMLLSEAHSKFLERFTVNEGGKYTGPDPDSTSKVELKDPFGIKRVKLDTSSFLSFYVYLISRLGELGSQFTGRTDLENFPKYYY